MLKELLRFQPLRECCCPAVTKAFLSAPEAWTYWKESSEGKLKWLKDWSISPVKKTETARTVWSGKEKAQGISSTYINTWREEAKKREPGCFNWCSVLRPDTMGTHWNIGSLWTSRKHFFSVKLSEHCPDCPERSWNPHPLRNSKVIWRWTWATHCRWFCLSRWFGPDCPNPIYCKGFMVSI